MQTQSFIEIKIKEATSSFPINSNFHKASFF